MSDQIYDDGEYKPRVGLDSLYIAEVTEDVVDGYTADTPEYLAPAAEATQASTINTETIYADDQPYDVFTSKGETAIELTVTNIPLEKLARLTGQYFNVTDGIFDEYGGIAPYFALMFRSKKSNGSYRYYLYPKCRFDIPDEEAATQTDSPDPKMTKIKVHAIKTTCKFDISGDISDGLVRRIGDEDVTAFDPTDWFTSVQVPVVTGESA